MTSVEGALISRPVVSRHGIFFWFLRSLVKVRYTFFLTTVLLGLRGASQSGWLLSLGIWIVVAFAAVLLHECGHALAARYYRQKPQIELHAMGGVTSWAWVDELKWHQRIVISLAGPAAGFLLAGLVLAADRAWPFAAPRVLLIAQYQFLWATLAWGAFNLLPLMPMDGGQALAEFLEHRLGRDEGRLLARKVSIGVGVAGLGAGILANEAWAGLLCGMFAFDNYQRMKGGPGIRLPT
jgi:stage IV sporulation protein FB